MKKVIIWTVAVLNIILILMMLAVGYSGYLNPLSHPMWASLGLFFPLFLLANVCFVAFWCFFRWRMLWLPVLGFLLCFPPLRLYIPLNPPSSPPEGAIKVLSYNVMGFDSRHMEENEVNQIAEYVVESDADIVCLQESGKWGKWGQRIDSMLQARYPHYVATPHPGKSPDHLSVYSRFPVLSSEMIPFESNQNFSMAYVLNVNGERVLVVNNHLESNKLSYDDKDSFDLMTRGKLSNDSAKHETKHIFDKLAEALKKRAPQADAVASYIKNYRDKGMSIIVCGDFNDSPLSYTHRKVCDGLTDCYVSSGNGPGFTYHQNRIYVRIDNIFCSDDWKPYACKVDTKVAQSDHYPVVCWLKKQPKR